MLPEVLVGKVRDLLHPRCLLKPLPKAFMDPKAPSAHEFELQVSSDENSQTLKAERC
jgi:hypothetical protein